MGVLNEKRCNSQESMYAFIGKLRRPTNKELPCFVINNPHLLPKEICATGYYGIIENIDLIKKECMIDDNTGESFTFSKYIDVCYYEKEEEKE
jgi:hypothetical protein